MTTAVEVESFFEGLRSRLEALDAHARSRLPERSVMARCVELDLAYRTQLVGGALTPAEPCRHEDRADIVFEFEPADVERLLAGTLDVRDAWLRGRLRVLASPLDLLRLRSLR